MLSKETVEEFQRKGYTFEEIERINKSLECIERGELIPFEDVIEEFYNNNNNNNNNNKTYV